MSAQRILHLGSSSSSNQISHQFRVCDTSQRTVERSIFIDSSNILQTLNSCQYLRPTVSAAPCLPLTLVYHFLAYHLARIRLFKNLANRFWTSRNAELIPQLNKNWRQWIWILLHWWTTWNMPLRGVLIKNLEKKKKIFTRAQTYASP